MTKLLPFDLEAAKAGAKVIKRGGRPARIVCWDRVEIPPLRVCPVVALVLNNDGYEEPHLYSSDGKFHSDGKPSHLDLFLAPTPVKRWRVVYRGADDNAAQRDFEAYNEAYKFFYDNRGYSSLPYEVEVTP